ncbi:hypothetical protein EDD11_005365 [Mortierella claussenii]|nr:hypothetical protein EDD11_005365 [Mortierella claussenii]
MAEEAPTAPSRLSKTRGDPADSDTLLRQPEPVPRAQDFFTTPRKSFDLDSVPHDMNELGVAVPKPQLPTDAEQEQQEEKDGQKLALASSLPGSLLDHVTVLKLHTRDEKQQEAYEEDEGEDEDEDMNENAEEPEDIPLSIPGSLLDSPARKKLKQVRDNAAKPASGSVAETEIAQTTNNSQSIVNPATSGDSVKIEKDHTAAVAADEAVQEDQNEGSFDCLFPNAEPVSGLVLSGPPNASRKDEHEEEEEILMSYPSLSDISLSHPPRDETGLPFFSSITAESTFLEAANSLPWDRLDDEQSDIEMDNGFGAFKRENLLAVVIPNNNDDYLSRVSPFAHYIPDSEHQQPLAKAAESSAKSASESEDKSDSDGVNVSHVLEELAGAATSSTLMKRFLLDKKDSDGDSSSADIRSHQSIRTASRQKSYLPNAFDTHSSSDDGLDTDHGAGVGAGASVGVGLAANAPSEDASSEPSTPRFSVIEKGKQVDRGSELSEVWDQDLSTDDLPPIASLAEQAMSAIASSPMFSLQNQKQVASDVASDKQGARSIYPAAPPAPWASEPLTNKLSQRRSTLTARTTVSPAAKSNDANLAFMGPPRKSTTTVPPITGVKSLLSDFADAPSTPPSAANQPVMTLPADPTQAPVLRGQYELPSIKKIEKWKSANTLAPNTFRRLLINVGALDDCTGKKVLWKHMRADQLFFQSRRLMQYSLRRSTVKFLSGMLGSARIFNWLEWGVTFVLLINVAEVIYSYTKSSNNFENLPLTPSQRSLLGLDPVISKVPGAVPVFKKSTAVPQNLLEKPMMSTYVNPSQGPFTSSRTPFQKPAVGTASLEYRDAATILNKSMARSFNQSSVQDKADLSRLMRNVEAREELQNEWKGPETDPAKRAFSLHSGFNAPQNGLQAGVDMAVPDLLTSLNSRGPVARYQPALRTTLSKDHTSKADLQKDGLYVVGYSKVLKNLKVSEQQLDRWSFNLRKWLWNKIVMHVCSEMEAVDAELAKQGLSYLDCKNATMFYASVPVSQNVNGASSTAAPAPAPLASSLAWGAASVATTRLPSAFGSSQPQQPQLPTSLQDLEARYGNSNIVKQRLYLESYLAVPGCANRKYVVERLQAMGPLLTHFIWDSYGVSWDNGKKSWSPDLPSDAQIIMHLFLTYLDTNMPSQPSEVFDRFPFTYRHYVPMENKPDPTTALQIKQISKSPPDYSLVKEGSLWEVVPKRLNVWYTMVLFIYMVMKENGGYIGQVNIGTQRIGLGDVVEGYDM